VRPRREGYTYVDIGVQLGISRQRAHQLVSDELRQLRGQTSEATEDLRWLELDRLALLTKDKRGAAAIGAC
jgi:DNA-directed RNA polymerase sigma subunit (sigma70/sigma32)